jgi:rhodanese-related sulfurtransferase
MKVLNYLIFLPILLMVTMSCSNAADTDTKNEVIIAEGKTIIVDVRTTEEWINDGHAKCTVNYPLDILNTKIDSLKAFDTIILVCRSGSRAGRAKGLLEEAGLKNIENKGAWQNINCK